MKKIDRFTENLVLMNNRNSSTPNDCNKVKSPNSAHIF